MSRIITGNYFQANGKALKNGDNSKVALKTVNGKNYAFDDEGKMLFGWVSADNAERIDDTDGDGFKESDYYFGGEDDGAMTAEWSLDVDNIRKKASSSDTRRARHSTPTTNSVAAKYAQEWRYFSAVEDGAKIKKGWFKVVAAEYLNYDKYNDDENGWYYADGSGNLYAGEFKTIKGKKYAFRNDGRMISGLKFIRDNDGSLDVWADDDPYRFDTEDDFDTNVLTLKRMGYNCYYFGDGDDGSMKTTKLNVEIDGKKYNFYLEKSGGLKGAGKTGEKDDKYYQSGKLLRAGSDEKYQVVEKKTQSKLDDVQDFIDRLDAIKTEKSLSADLYTRYEGTIPDAVVKRLNGLGVSQTANDLSEVIFLEYVSAVPSDQFFLVNTSGKIIDSNSKNKDGNDYYYVVQKSGSISKIVAIYVED